MANPFSLTNLYATFADQDDPVSPLSVWGRNTYLNQVAFIRKERAKTLQDAIDDTVWDRTNYRGKPYINKKYIKEYYREDYVADRIEELKSELEEPLVAASREDQEQQALIRQFQQMDGGLQAASAPHLPQALPDEKEVKEREARIAELKKKQEQFVIHSDETADCATHLLADLRIDIIETSKKRAGEKEAEGKTRLQKTDSMIEQYKKLEQALNDFNRVGSYKHMMFIEPYHRLFCTPDNVQTDAKTGELSCSYKINGYSFLWPPKWAEYLLEVANGFLDRFGSKGGTMEWNTYEDARRRQEEGYQLFKPTTGSKWRRAAVFLARLIFIAPLQGIVDILAHPLDFLFLKLWRYLKNDKISTRAKVALSLLHILKLGLIVVSALFSAGVLTGPAATAFDSVFSHIMNWFSSTLATPTIAPLLVLNSVPQGLLNTAQDSVATSRWAEAKGVVVPPVPDTHFPKSPESEEIDAVAAKAQKQNFDIARQPLLSDDIDDIAETKNPLYDSKISVAPNTQLAASLLQQDRSRAARIKRGQTLRNMAGERISADSFMPGDLTESHLGGSSSSAAPLSSTTATSSGGARTTESKLPKKEEEKSRTLADRVTAELKRQAVAPSTPSVPPTLHREPTFSALPGVDAFAAPLLSGSEERSDQPVSSSSNDHQVTMHAVAMSTDSSMAGGETKLAGGGDSAHAVITPVLPPTATVGGSGDGKTQPPPVTHPAPPPLPASFLRQQAEEKKKKEEERKKAAEQAVRPVTPHAPPPPVHVAVTTSVSAEHAREKRNPNKEVMSQADIEQREVERQRAAEAAENKAREDKDRAERLQRERSATSAPSISQSSSSGGARVAGVTGAEQATGVGITGGGQPLPVETINANLQQTLANQILQAGLQANLTRMQLEALNSATLPPKTEAELAEERKAIERERASALARQQRRLTPEEIEKQKKERELEHERAVDAAEEAFEREEAEQDRIREAKQRSEYERQVREYEHTEGYRRLFTQSASQRGKHIDSKAATLRELEPQVIAATKYLKEYPLQILNTTTGKKTPFTWKMILGSLSVFDNMRRNLDGDKADDLRFSDAAYASYAHLHNLNETITNPNLIREYLAKQIFLNFLVRISENPAFRAEINTIEGLTQHIEKHIADLEDQRQLALRLKQDEEIKITPVVVTAVVAPT